MNSITVYRVSKFYGIEYSSMVEKKSYKKEKKRKKRTERSNKRKRNNKRTARMLLKSNSILCPGFVSFCFFLSGCYFIHETGVEGFKVSFNQRTQTGSWSKIAGQSLLMSSKKKTFLAKRGIPHGTWGTSLELVNRRQEETANATDSGLKNNDSRGQDWNKLTKQVSAFVEMSVPYFKESNAGRWLLVGMIGMLFLNSGVSVLFSYLGRDFWTALSSKDPERFTEMLIKYVAALAVGAPVSAYYRFQREKLAIEWREWMTDRTFQLYTSNRVYYALERGRDIDNPDQRIAEDVRSFTTFSLELIITILTSIIDLFSFSAILFSIQPQLFWVIIIYSAFGTLSSAFLGRKLVTLNFDRLFREADFRYSLVRMRDNAESIAFYSGEDIEGKEVSKRLNKAIETRRDINVAQRNLDFFTTSYRYLIQVLPISVVAPQYFAEKIELGVISQSVGAFNHILNDLSIIVNNIESLASFSAGIDRLSQFLTAIREIDPDRPADSPLLSFAHTTQTSSKILNDSELLRLMDGKLKLESNEVIDLRKVKPLDFDQSSFSEVLLVKDLYLTTPDSKRILISNLSFALKRGEHLLIVGTSGAGKSSLLRSIAGLWTSGSGIIERLSDEDVYFLPQRPYCTLGTLKDQLLYPSMDELLPEDYPAGHRLNKSHLLRSRFSDQDLLKILDKVGLSELPVRVGDGDPMLGLSRVLDWSNTLSLGEQQRLAFCRVLVNRPHLIICDEATSALDMEAERKMYELTKAAVPDATIVSVGHRPSLMRYHDFKLRVSQENCEFSKIEASLIEKMESVVLVDNM